MQPRQKLLARAGQLLPLLLAHQMLAAQLPGPGLTTPEPNKSHRHLRRRVGLLGMTDHAHGGFGPGHSRCDRQSYAYSAAVLRLSFLLWLPPSAAFPCPGDALERFSDRVVCTIGAMVY